MFCTICLVNLQANSALIVTGCGHSFHANCWEKWMKSSKGCPACHKENPGYGNIYIAGEVQEIHIKNSLISQLEEKTKQLRQLETQLKEGTGSCSLQKNISPNTPLTKFQEECLEVMTLDLKLSKTKLFTLQEQHSEIQDLNRKLQKELESLKAQNIENVSAIENLKGALKNKEQIEKSLRDELNEKSVGINRLKTNFEKVKRELGLRILNEMETRTTQKMSLEVVQKLLEELKDIHTPIEDDIEILATSARNLDVSNAPGESENLQAENASSPSNKSINGTNRSSITNSVMIRKIPIDEIQNLTKEFALSLAQKMGLDYTSHDIEEVYKLDKEDTAVVKFKTLKQTMDFLKYKNKLKNDSIASQYQMTEYVNNDVYALFHYARCLKNVGYQFVYYKNNQVWAKWNKDAHEIKIESEKEVDELVLNKVKTNE